MDDQPEQDAQDPRPTEAPGDPHADNLARYGAPLPPPAFPQPGPFQDPTAYQYPAAYQYPPASPTPGRRRGRRLLAAGTALAAVAVAGGAGFALGHVDRQGQPTAGGPPAGYAGRAPNQQQNQQPNQESPFGNLSPFGGMPFSGPGGQGDSPFDSAQSGTPASDSQLTGLVRIASTLKYEHGRAAGTGMIVSSNGEVITNHHVVEGSTKLRVTVMSTGATYVATVVGTDAKDDVAVIQLQDASGLQTVTPDTDGIAVGDAVTAVGDANGAKTFTAADGKILATHQQIRTSSEPGHPGEQLRNLIKISSDVISGDSGGATYDDQGEVVGMTTAASSGTSDVVGFAIPIAKVLSIAGDLENGTQNARYDYGSPAFLGLGLTGNNTRVGAVYPGTPAARAGVSVGDTITGVGSTRVRTADQLRSAVEAFSPGDTVRITWNDADGTSHIASVTLMAGPVA